MSSPFSKDDLFTLYKIAIDEYRFEVKLNWDRTVFYMTLNSSLVAIATGLLKVDGAPPLNLLVAAIFFIGLCTATIGVLAIHKGHEYYRRTIIKKTLLEDQLGLTKGLEGYSGRPTLAVGTTVGQGDHVEILDNPERYIHGRLRPRSLSFWVLVILCFFGAMNIVGICGSVWLYNHPPPATATPPLPFNIH